MSWNWMTATGSLLTGAGVGLLIWAQLTGKLKKTKKVPGRHRVTSR